MNKNYALILGSIFGLIAIILGAFAAHKLKDLLPTNALESFQTGVKYQMYHALLLLIIGFNSEKIKNSNIITYIISIGTVLFSFSIYVLSLKTVLKINNLNFLGPITPIGGLMLIIGWGMLLKEFLSKD